MHHPHKRHRSIIRIKTGLLQKSGKVCSIQTVHTVTSWWEGALELPSANKNSCHMKHALLHLTDEETEVQRGPVTCLRYHSVPWSADGESSSLWISLCLSKHWGQTHVFVAVSSGRVGVWGKQMVLFMEGDDRRDESGTLNDVVLRLMDMRAEKGRDRELEPAHAAN